MKGYKGFNSKLQCKGHQYEVGKEYEEEGASCCNYGFHFCENPLDVFNYYPPSDSRFCEVEGSGKIDKVDGDDSKVAASKIRIGAEIGLPGLIKAGVEYIKSNVDWENAKESNTGDWSAATNTGNRSAATNTGNRSAATNTGDQSAATNTGDWSAATNTGNRSAATNTGDWSAATNTGNRSAATNTGYRSAATNTGDQSAATNTGDWSAATNTGDWSAATNTGDQSAATNTGDWSAATVEGKDSIACALGVEGKAKGKKGCWLVLAQWEWEFGTRKLIEVRSVLVDGEVIKKDTFYSLRNGNVVEVE
jgi:hypothetical protein